MGRSVRWSSGGGDGGRMGEDGGLAFGRSVLFPSRTGPVYDT